MSTPSDDHPDADRDPRSVPAVNAAIFALAFGSSDRISTGASPVTRSTISA